MDTLLLDRAKWDLVLTTSGDIAVASTPYALAQDAASNIRTYLGEVWYDTTKGTPFMQQILGQAPPLSLVRDAFQRQAAAVPGVVKTKVYFTDFKDRTLSGQVQVSAEGKTFVAAGF